MSDTARVGSFLQDATADDDVRALWCRSSLLAAVAMKSKSPLCTMTLFFLILVGVMGARAFSPVPCLVSTRRRSNTGPYMSDPMGSDNESTDVIRSLIDFHDGSWEGTATSFSVTPDVAAGIVQKKTSPKYKTSIKLGLGEDGMTMTETFDFDDKISSRTIPLIKSNMDVDAVDGSYSLDTSLPNVPSAITGTEKLAQFGIEHVIAVNDDARARCLAFYGVDDGSLARVVIMHEQRIQGTGVKADAAQSTQDDLLALDSDLDRIVDKIAGQVKGGSDETAKENVSEDEDRMKRLQKAMQSRSSAEEGPSLSLHPMSLLELSSGVWLGDAIVRDLPNVAATPFDSGKGFGSSKPTATEEERRDFANWDVGVQKNAWRWIWRLGESIRQEDEVGNAMGTPMAKCLADSLSGTVCVNESLSRRIPKDQRMVYVNWDNGDYVSFILGSTSVQVSYLVIVLLVSCMSLSSQPYLTTHIIFACAAPEISQL